MLQRFPCPNCGDFAYYVDSEIRCPSCESSAKRSGVFHDAGSLSQSFDPYYTWLGIPPGDQPPDHYQLLGVDLFESDAELINNAADRQIARVQAATAGNYADLSQQLLNEISTARLWLFYPNRRAEYDRNLRMMSQHAVPLPVTVSTSDATLPVTQTTTARCANLSGVSPTRRRPYQRKNPFVEAFKIVVGGVVGICLARVILWVFRSFLA